MAGAGTVFFTARKAAYEEQAQQASNQVAEQQRAVESAAAHANAASAALAILAKPALTPADGEQLISYYEQLQ